MAHQSVIKLIFARALQRVYGYSNITLTKLQKKAKLVTFDIGGCVIFKHWNLRGES